MAKILDAVKSITKKAIEDKREFSEKRFTEIIEQIKNVAKNGNRTIIFLETDVDDNIIESLRSEGFGISCSLSVIPSDIYGSTYKKYRITW